jgi:succinate dehydrogenase/fumarate reductase flavoprotein subunit
MGEARNRSCDLLVVGSGAGAFAAALTAGVNGLDVLMVEKEPVFGGATARSGGWLWIPGNPHAAAAGLPDSRAEARTYLQACAGNHFRAEHVDAFLDNAPAMISFFEDRTAARFVAVPGFPDYHPDLPGSRPGRSIRTRPFDGRELGADIERLRPTFSFAQFAGMTVGTEDMPAFLTVARKLSSWPLVAARLAELARDRLVHGRPMRLANGNALIARLAKTARDLAIPIWTSAPASELIVEDGRVAGAVVETADGPVRVSAARGVVLATGGYGHDKARRAALYPPGAGGDEHWALMPPGNSGDGLRLAESVGGQLHTDLAWPGILTPVMRLAPGGDVDAFPKFAGRAKPGVIAVARNGRRFTNEANSYHDFGQALLAACKDEADAWAIVLCDRRSMRRYGLGPARPFPSPIGHHLRAGNVLQGRTLAELAARAGVDGEALHRTVADFNGPAREGRDPEFGRGGNAYNVAMGDEDHRPNPCIAPLDTAPFYAIKVVPGIVGTFAGLRTDASARVLGEGGAPIPGLYAAGNDLATVFGGDYVGGGTTLGPAMTFGYIAGRHAAGVG